MYKKSFTLTEVIITFTLIGILSVAMVPMFHIQNASTSKMRVRHAYYSVAKGIEALLNSPPYDEFGTFEAANIIPEGSNDEAYAKARVGLFCANLARVLNASFDDCYQDEDGGPARELGNLTRSSVTVDGVTLQNTCMDGTPFADSDNQPWRHVCPDGSAFAMDPSYDKYSRYPLVLTTKEVSGKVVPDYDKMENIIDYICRNNDGVNDILVRNMWLGVSRTNFSFTGTITINGVKQPAEYAIICVEPRSYGAVDYGEHYFGLAVRKDGKIIQGKKVKEYIDSSIYEGD